MHPFNTVSRRLVTGLTALAGTATVTLALAAATSPAASGTVASPAKAAASVASVTPARHQALQASSGLVKRIPNAIRPLPGCAVTFTPKVGSTAGRTCAVPLPASAAARRAAMNPDESACNFDYYQNGPYGSAAWRSGWGECVWGYDLGGTYYVPLTATFQGLGTVPVNDQASSWDSCAGGEFYANQPFTDPAATFPTGSAGNFPWGVPPNQVPNDSLSSAFIFSNNC